MKIFDCFMYFDEEKVLELRLNILDEYVDYFVIVESSFTHKGDKRDLKFNHQKFKKFKDKLIYITYDEEPVEIIKNKVNVEDDEATKSFKSVRLNTGCSSEYSKPKTRVINHFDAPTINLTKGHKST